MENICPIEVSISVAIHKINSLYTIDVDDAIVKSNETLSIIINSVFILYQRIMQLYSKLKIK